MPAKKKTPKVNIGKSALKALNSLTEADVEQYWQRRAFQAEERLAELDKERRALRGELLAEKRELEFWVEQSDGFRDQIIHLLRKWAEEQVPQQ